MGSSGRVALNSWPTLVLLLGVVLLSGLATGCGGGGGGVTLTGDRRLEALAETLDTVSNHVETVVDIVGAISDNAAIVVVFSNAGTRLSTATQASFVGTDDRGDVLFGPYTEALAPSVVLRHVPVSVVSLLVVTRGSDGGVVSTNSHPVTLTRLNATWIYDPLALPTGLSSLAVTPATSAVAPRTRLHLVATGTFSNGSVQDLTAFVTWTSSRPEVASVSQIGIVSASSPGQTLITANSRDLAATADVTVDNKTLTDLQVTPIAPIVPAGQPQAFRATGIFNDRTVQDLTADVAWNTSDSSVAAFSSDATQAGVATTYTGGTCSVTASLFGVTGQSHLVVQPATLDAIQVSPQLSSLPKGHTVQLIATGIFSNNLTLDITRYVQWTTSNDDLCVVSNLPNSAGTVYATGSARDAVITATLAGVSGNATVRLTPATLAALQVTPRLAEVAGGSVVRFVATGVFSDGTVVDLTDTVTWASSAPATAVIGNERRLRGLCLGRQSGAVTVTALDPATGIVGSAALTVTSAVPKVGGSPRGARFIAARDPTTSQVFATCVSTVGSVVRDKRKGG